jgi:cytochrome P450
MEHPRANLSAPPGPSGPFLGMMVVALRDPLLFLQNMRAEYGDVVTLRKGVAFLVANPEGIKHVLQDNHPNYQKGARYRMALGRLMGDGLLTAEGEAWKLQRRIAQPAFLRRQHEFFAETIATHCAQLVAGCVQYAKSGAAFDLHHAIAHHSLAIMLHLLFSEDLGEHSQDLSRAFLTVEHDLNIARVFLPLQVPQWLPTPSNLRFKHALAVLDAFIQEVIALRRSGGAQRADLLSAYLHMRDGESESALSDKLLRDEMITLLSAGHETVSDAITWAFYELMNHPDAYARVLAEADASVPDANPLAAASALPFTTMVIQEALRLYPPGWGFLRTAIGADTICGYTIPAGSRVIVSPYLIQRDSAYWDDPDRFEPERFTEERSAERHRFAWFPFSAGPRQCIGAGLATLEAQLTIMRLSRVIRLELVPGQTIRPLPRVSLKPNGPVMVRAHLRAGGLRRE